MHKAVLFVVSFITAIFLLGVVSATDYGFTKSYTVKETYDDYGYTYYQKSVDKTPWGETTRYTRVKDYDNAPVFFIYNKDPYKNKVSDYWNDGPYKGYSKTVKVVDKRYDDSYVRERTGSQYYHYYNEPTKVYVSDRYGGSMYWDHSYQGYNCDNGNYCWR